MLLFIDMNMNCRWHHHWRSQKQYCAHSIGTLSRKQESVVCFFGNIHFLYRVIINLVRYRDLLTWTWTVVGIIIAVEKTTVCAQSIGTLSRILELAVVVIMSTHCMVYSMLLLWLFSVEHSHAVVIAILYMDELEFTVLLFCWVLFCLYTHTNIIIDIQNMISDDTNKSNVAWYLQVVFIYLCYDSVKNYFVIQPIFRSIKISFWFLIIKISNKKWAGCCQSKNRLNAKMLRVHVFNIFTIKTPCGIAALAPFGILIVKILNKMYSNYNIIILLI